MKTKHWLINYSVSLLLFSAAAPVTSTEYSSTREMTKLIELFTSEGCSSCPPADNWLRQLKFNPQLFKKFIPLSFHVDYWNQLGWKDRFSKRQFTNRQYQHYQQGRLSQVYTPGFVVNNEEWRDWRLSQPFYWLDNQKQVGILKVDYKQGLQQLNISFSPEIIIKDNALLVNVAILGMNLSSTVESGENSGHILKHDFVVLTHTQQHVSLTNSKTQQWQLTTPKIPKKRQNINVLVVWISNVTTQHVIQATGGYL